MSSEPQLRVALASYDVRELRVQKRYLEEQNPFIRCSGWQNGQNLLTQLRGGLECDVIVLCSQLEDMDAMEFIARLRRLPSMPLLLLFDERRHGRNAASCLHSDGSCYMIKQADLKNLLEELYKAPGRQALRADTLCRQLYAEWGISRPDANCGYLTSALRIACASDDRLALRKELLQKVSEEHCVTVAAVDSGLRRMVDELEEQQPEGWRAFKQKSGLAAEKPSTGRLIYAVKECLLARGLAR